MLAAPHKIGLTGGIGAGKSKVGELFKLLGIPVYEADRHACRLIEQDQELIKGLQAALGAGIYNPDQTLNKRALAASIFKDPQKLATLNQWVHPKVLQDFNAWAVAQPYAPYVIKEAAILLDTGRYKQLDKLIVVTAPEWLRKKRVQKRDSHKTEEEIKAVMQNQWKDTQRVRYADFIIHNDEKAALMPQVRQIHQALLSMEQ
ncbi:MAG: dephospho-CoA kinase [Bacteroidota bacterium]